MNQEFSISRQVAEFTFGLRYPDLPQEALRIAKRCILDGLGVILAGSDQPCTAIVRRQSIQMGIQPEATLLGTQATRLAAPLAALVNGTAGHAMDWDDTQLSSTPDRVFGLLTHPTIPPLAAALATAEKVGGVSGRDFLTAFLAGFEVECKIAEAINPEHYQRGLHSSGTIGTLGAAMAAGKLLGLSTAQLRHTLGAAASMAAGLRVSFGTMMKPVHVGRAAFSGLSAALWAADGFAASPDGLDGPWGFFQVTAGGYDPQRIAGRLGRPYAIVDPGVSVKPYPCGSLAHPSMDAMLDLVREENLQPEDIAEVVLYAGSNILKPIRYAAARNELEAKFCMPFLLSAMIISRRAGVNEFTDAYVNSAPLQAMMRRIRTALDPAIEARGYAQMLSRLEVLLTNGRKLVRDSAEAYRGGPHNPLSEEELQTKFADCAQRIFDARQCSRVFRAIAELERIGDVRDLTAMLGGSKISPPPPRASATPPPDAG